MFLPESYKFHRNESMKKLSEGHAEYVFALKVLVISLYCKHFIFNEQMCLKFQIKSIRANMQIVTTDRFISKSM